MNEGCNDASFGPAVGSNCRGGFDFTLFFEHVVLSVSPSVVLLLCVPPRLYYLLRQDMKAKPKRAFHRRTVGYP